MSATDASQWFFTAGKRGASSEHTNGCLGSLRERQIQQTKRTIDAENASFYFSVNLWVYYTIPHISSSIEEQAESEDLLFTWSNGGPRPLECQLLGTTRTRGPRSFRKRRDRRQQWWRMEWKWVPWHHTERVPMRGLRGGQEPEVKRERRTLLRNRRGHRRPNNKARDSK